VCKSGLQGECKIFETGLNGHETCHCSDVLYGYGDGTIIIYIMIIDEGWGRSVVSAMYMSDREVEGQECLFYSQKFEIILD
jgi:hypothetical protein